MTTNKSKYTCLEKTSMIVSDEQEQLLNVKRLTLARKVLQAGHVHAPSVEALILKQMKASQRNNTNHTCHDLPTSLEQVALTVVSQPQNYIVGDGEELKHLVLARKVMETRHLHLPTFNALSLKRFEALEQNIRIEKQDPRPSRTSIPMDQPSAEPSTAAPADTSFSKSRQYRFALTCAFITKSNNVAICMFGPLSLLFDQDKKQYTLLEQLQPSSETCLSVSFAADAICSSRFSDVEGDWLTLGLHKDLERLYLVFKKQAEMMDFLTGLRW